MRSEQFVVQSADSDCTGNEAPVAGISALVTFDVAAESQWLLIDPVPPRLRTLSWVRGSLFLMRNSPSSVPQSYDHQNALL